MQRRRYLEGIICGTIHCYTPEELLEAHLIAVTLGVSVAAPYVFVPVKVKMAVAAQPVPVIEVPAAATPKEASLRLVLTELVSLRKDIQQIPRAS